MSTKMQERRKYLLLQVLDTIEQQESRLLVWGVVDGFFNRSELLEIIDPIIDSALEMGAEDFFQVDDVIKALIDLKWLIEVESFGGEICYRSRMAETVRLLLRLRQLFPKHARTGTGWQEAPTLVADFRFQRRRRIYPLRDVEVNSTLQRLRAVTSNVAILSGALALLRPGGTEVLLASFQVRAAERILRGIETGDPLATIVCAGTGSGKTLAFYLPALASITRHHLDNRESLPWVKTVAIYPRLELLKDQLREVINRSLQLMENLKDQKPAVTIRIGALFSDIPKNINRARSDWKKSGNDLICPSLRCIRCESDLLWRHADYSSGRERLECRNCHFIIDGSIFPLTRESLSAFPPDILLTTTEMLNQRLSDNSLNHLFGVGLRAQRPPELVLLDEVHTYEGRHGAQVAYLMRRWQHLVDQPLSFVGLSATLREADSFFASLTGAKPNFVQEISPRQDEMKTEGAEYLIALRGDPVSRTALLSTTIQATFLLQRCLDPNTDNINNSISQGVFGRRTFVFTDDLDVTNRLYFDLLSAEGRNSSGNPDMRQAPRGGLAVLREHGTSILRYQSGQDWRMCESLGHRLSTRLVIDRVSSQDRGINANADVVVATAALEVGFDDSTVGAVIQHKAPKGIASFLQRKGRAGRTRDMRPWTAIVLSDYGRDRLAYQGYDLLFDPELPVRTLPLTNRYIMRMQAVFATIDFLGKRLQDTKGGSIWRNLASPSGEKERTKILIKELHFILESKNGTQRLGDYLHLALRITREEVSTLLWEYPRPLITTVLPTALRRLRSGWCAGGQVGADYQIRNNPLPDFIPATLFADLNLAEVQIELPVTPRLEDEPMSIFSALKDFAPGRVSRRFGVRDRTERYWVAPPGNVLAGTSSSLLEIGQFSTHVPIGEFGFWRDGTSIHVPVFRPVRLIPSVPPTQVTDTSNAHPIWHTQLVPLGQPLWLQPPSGSIWNTLIPKLGFFMHAHHSPIEVRRFATGSTAEVGIGPGVKVNLSVEFRQAGQSAALGAAFPADGVVFQVKIPERLYASNSSSKEKWCALRAARFMDCARRGDALSNVPNSFMRDWLAQVFISALTYEAIQHQVNLNVAADSIANGTASIPLNQVLSILFQSQVINTPDGETRLGGQDHLRRDLDVLLSDPAILDELHSLARVLWEPISDEWEPWLRNVYQCSLGAALLRSIVDLCPTINPDDLAVDLGRGPIVNAHLAPFESYTKEIWITEKSPGGTGLIEEFMRSYAEDPRRFFSMVRSSLEICEFEFIDQQLTQLLKVMVDEDSNSRTRELVHRFRATSSHAEMMQVSKDLRLALVREGYSPFHGFLVSMGNRILRPGAGSATDRFLYSSIQRWNTEEARLGIEIDLRVICYWLSQSSEIDAVVSESGIPVGQDLGSWRMSTIYGLLWPRGRAIRKLPLQLRNHFVDLPEIERFLVIDTICDDRVRVSVEDGEWLERTAELLAAGRLVTVTCPERTGTRLAEALNALITNPVETGYLRAYARLQGFRRSVNMLEADLELLEAVQ